MRLMASDEKLYPKLHRYIRKRLPSIIHNPKIVAGFAKYGQLTKPALIVALRYGTNPLIRVTSMKSDCGQFQPGIPSLSHEIKIETRIVKQMETLGRKKDILLVGATILHEMVHWADDKDGIDYPREEGELFEKAVYGHVIPCVL